MVNRNVLQRTKKNLYLQTFLWGAGLSFLFFIPWIIFNNGYFFFYGDFNVQQIPFYQMIHDELLSGNLGWSYTTDLGANIIGSYSFYMIGSPFFWLTLLFPSQAVPYLMAPLLMVKFGLAAMSAYIFLQRYVRDQRYAMIGGLLYAFSGFGIYNIFFNHFHEAMITFPLMLAALDAFIYDKRKGVFAAAVFAGAFINYYFFAGQAVFIFIYWCFRMVTKSYRMKLTEFLRLVLEILLGFLAAAAVLIPSVLAVLQNSRLDNFPHGWSALAYPNEQRYIHIALSLFFPPDMPAYANFTPDSNAKWASVAAWLPLFSMVGVFSFYRLKTHKWLRELIPALIVMMFIPILNCTYQVLNITFYARWYYMLTMMLSFATVICLDNEKTDFRPALIRTFVITAGFTLLIGFIPEDSPTAEKWNGKLGLEKYPDRFWGWCAIAFVGILALTIVLCFRQKKYFKRILSITLSVFIVLYANILIGVGVLNASYRREYIQNAVIDNKDTFHEKFPDIKNVRSDFYHVMDNVGMYWQIPTIQAFQSIVPGSVMKFYPSVGVERSVGSRPETKYYGLRGLLSVKYLFDYDGDGYKFKSNSDVMEMPGWKFVDNTQRFDVFENQYYIPYGFTYDEYITEDQYDIVSKDEHHLLLLKAILLDEEQEKKYADILQHHQVLSEYTYTINEYYKDCIARRQHTCESVQFEKNKITAVFPGTDQDELVFFSIPYEDGWKVQVNGKDAEIEKVNVGFMAVRVPANQRSEIVFTYETPGLKLGLLVSGVSIVLFVLYMLLWKSPKRKKGTPLTYLEDDPEHEPDPMDTAYPEEYLSATGGKSYTYFERVEKEPTGKAAEPKPTDTKASTQPDLSNAPAEPKEPEASEPQEEPKTPADSDDEEDPSEPSEALPNKREKI